MNTVTPSRIKTISAFLFLSLILFSITTPFNAEAKSVDNPYGEGEWQLHNGWLKIIHKNGTHFEQRHSSLSLSKITSKIMNQTKSFSKLKIKLKEKSDNNPYWNRHDLNYSKNITIKVSKSNNMAYIEPSGDLIGFNPFYVYDYTNTKITNKGHGEITLNLDKKYNLYYVSEYSFGYSGVMDREAKVFKINHCLGVSSKKEIRFRRLQFANNPNLTTELQGVTYKGHYPTSYQLVLPAEHILMNCTTEEYVILGGELGYHQNKAVEFLHSVDNGGEPDYMNFSIVPWRLVAVPALIIPSAVVGYLAYKKRKG